MGERLTVRSAGNHRVEASNGVVGTTLELAKSDGGPGTALGPHETLLAALGGCTVLTLEAYAARKAIPLEGVELVVERARAVVGEPESRERITVEIRLLGPLDDAQKVRLLEIAQKCPVYKTLTGHPEVVERLAT